MKSCVVTQALGDKWVEKILPLTRPRMEAYCKRTEQDFISIEKPLADPVQYTKLVIGNIMATRGYDQVTFMILISLRLTRVSTLTARRGWRIWPRPTGFFRGSSRHFTITLACLS